MFTNRKVKLQRRKNIKKFIFMNELIELLELLDCIY